jgi:hypothetical protein
MFSKTNNNPIWLHYTSNKIEVIKNIFNQFDYIKPSGLWGSYNDEWLKWCHNNGIATFDTDNYYLYEIKLKQHANILIIDSFDTYLTLLGYGKMLDWNKVKNDYDGVAFLNYPQIKKDMFNKNLMDTMICALDINCCCIWNHVYDLILIEHRVKISEDTESVIADRQPQRSEHI